MSILSCTLTKTPFRAAGNEHWLVHRSKNPHFTGRRDLISRIANRITSENAGDGQPRVVLTGLGGQGKSEICLHVVNEVRDRFWGIFWVDFSSGRPVEENFSEVAEALGCSKTVEAVRNTLSRLPPTKQWLLILDNADDPHRDYQLYIPSANRGAILMTSRNPQCGILATVGDHEELDSLEESECVQLLHKTARLSDVASNTEDFAFAVTLVKHLGHHTLAILHAGSFIATTHCSIADCLAFFRTNRRQLLERSSGQGQSRYDTVYATFGASIEFLEQQETGMTEETRKDALQLLEVLSTFHNVAVPLDLLVDAWEGVIKARKTPKQLETYSDELTAWHVAEVPDLVGTENCDVQFRITEAVARLESLALVRTDRSARAWKSVSMHPLVHGWAGDRHSRQERKQALLTTKYLVALSYYAFRTWRPYYYQFTPHVKLLAESDEELVDDVAQVRGVLQASVQIAWIYHRMGLHKDMYEFTGRIFQRLGLYDQEPTEEFRGLYRAFAVAVDKEGSYPAQTIRIFEAIACLDEKTLGENDPHRLYNMRDLGSAYGKNARTKEAVALLRKVVKACQELGEEHEDLLLAQHDLGVALSDDGQTKEAITLLESVVETRQRLFSEDDPDLLASQFQLAVAYLRDGQTAEATRRCEEVVRIRARTFGEEDLATANGQHCLADAYYQAGRLSEAVMFYERVINTRTLVLSESHSDLLAAQHDLASVYVNIGRIQEAINILEHVVNIRNSMLDDADHRKHSSLHLLGRAYLESDRCSEAIGMLERVIGFRKSIFENTDYRLLASRHELARAYLEVGRTSEAIEILGSVVDIEKSTIDEKNRNHLASQRLLGRAYLNAGRNSEAVRVLEQVVGAAALLYDEGHQFRIASQNLLDEARAGCDRSSSRLTETSLPLAENAQSGSVVRHSRESASGKSNLRPDVELEENESRG